MNNGKPQRSPDGHIGPYYFWLGSDGEVEGVEGIDYENTADMGDVSVSQFELFDD